MERFFKIPLTAWFIRVRADPGPFGGFGVSLDRCAWRQSAYQRWLQNTGRRPATRGDRVVRLLDRVAYLGVLLASPGQALSNWADWKIGNRLAQAIQDVPCPPGAPTLQELSDEEILRRRKDQEALVERLRLEHGDIDMYGNIVPYPNPANQPKE